jgi:hypothetical protein
MESDVVYRDSSLKGTRIRVLLGWGSSGNLWRITDCWKDYYNLRFYFNVACVNSRREAVQFMAAHMEELLLEPLAAGREIRYHHTSSANTDEKIDRG